MTDPSGGPDITPSQWADIAATYDTVASAYVERFLHELDHKPFDRALLERFAQATSSLSSADHPVCDVGCGPGHVGAFIAQFGLEVIGIDLSRAMVAQARQCWPSLTFRQGDMTALPLDDGAVSGIVCFYALIHIPRHQVPMALADMHRVLIRGGSLLLAVHGGAGTLHSEEMLDQPAPIDATLFGLTELTRLVEQSGFTVNEAIERTPYPEEHSTPRLYVWATKRP